MTVHVTKPHMTGKEIRYISQSHHKSHLSGDGPFTGRCPSP